MNKYIKLTAENVSFIKNNNPEIAIVAPTLDSIPTQNGNAIYSLIEELVIESKIPILVISKSGSENYYSEIKNQIIYCNYPNKLNILDKLMGYKLRKRIYGISHTPDSRYMRVVLDFLRKTNVKIIQIEDNNAFLPGIKKRDVKQFKFLLHQHANAPQNIAPKKWYKFSKKLTRVIAVSETTIDEIKKVHQHMITPIDCIYNGINLQNFPITRPANNEESNRFKLLFVGRINEGKGVLKLLEAVKALLKEGANIKLGLIGSLDKNYSDKNFTQKFKDYKLSMVDSVVHYGLVEQTKIAEYYANYDAVIIPSIHNEGLPKVTTEALIMGKLLIYSNRGGTHELVKHLINGIEIEEPIDAQTIGNAIKLAIKHQDTLSKNVQQQLSQNRKRFSTQEMARRFEKIYTEVLK